MTNKKALGILTRYVKRLTAKRLKPCSIPQAKYDLMLSDALKVALLALEKTIPKQPIFERDQTGRIMRCPSCHWPVYDSDSAYCFNKERHQFYCLSCGQRFTKPLNTLGEWAEE